jgi:hypothetical protein
MNTTDQLIKGLIAISNMHPGEPISSIQIEDGSGTKFNYVVNGQPKYVDLTDKLKPVKAVLFDNQQMETVSTFVLSKWFQDVKENRNKPIEDQCEGYQDYLHGIINTMAEAKG